MVAAGRGEKWDGRAGRFAAKLEDGGASGHTGVKARQRLGRVIGVEGVGGAASITEDARISSGRAQYVGCQDQEVSTNWTDRVGPPPSTMPSQHISKSITPTDRKCFEK